MNREFVQGRLLQEKRCHKGFLEALKAVSIPKGFYVEGVGVGQG